MTSPERIREIIEFVTTDAYTDDEVMSGWGVAFDDATDLPFQAAALGSAVTVLGFESDTQRGVRCEIQVGGAGTRWVGIDALDLDSLPERVREALDAYEAWSEGSY